MTVLDRWRAQASPEAKALTEGCRDLLKAHAQLWQAIGRLTERRSSRGFWQLPCGKSEALEQQLRNDAASLEVVWRATGVSQ